MAIIEAHITGSGGFGIMITRTANYQMEVLEDNVPKELAASRALAYVQKGDSFRASLCNVENEDLYNV